MSRRWTETDILTKSVGAVDFDLKRLKGQKRPAAAEVDKAEVLAERNKRPFVLYWRDEIASAGTPVIFVYQASKMFVHLISASRGRRPDSFITETNYATAENLIQRMGTVR